MQIEGLAGRAVNDVGDDLSSALQDILVDTLHDGHFLSTHEMLARRPYCGSHISIDVPLDNLGLRFTLGLWGLGPRLGVNLTRHDLCIDVPHDVLKSLPRLRPLTGQERR